MYTYSNKIVTMSCDRHYGIVQPPCSGHGTCVDSKCYCDSGWTSRTDSQISYTFDCDNSILYMKVFSIINFILSSIIILIFITRLYRFPPKDLNPRNISQISFLLAHCGSAAYHMSKLLDPVHYILSSNSPDTFPLSIGFGFYMLFIPIGMTGYLAQLINFLNGYSKIMSSEATDRINKRISYVYYLTPLMLFLAITFQFYTLFGIIYQSKSHFLFQATLAGSFAPIFFSYGLMIWYIIQGVLTEMKLCLTLTNNNNNNQNDEIKILYNKLLRIQRLIFMSLTCFGGPVCALFGIWYYLSRKFDYILHILSFLTSIIILSATINKKSFKIYPKNTYEISNSISNSLKLFKKSGKNNQLINSSSVVIHPIAVSVLPAELLPELQPELQAEFQSVLFQEQLIENEVK